MNAEEARNLAVTTDVSISGKWCRAIREIISIKASRGESRLSIGLSEDKDRIINYVVDDLKSDGYNVDFSGDTLDISWLQPSAQTESYLSAGIRDQDPPSHSKDLPTEPVEPPVRVDNTMPPIWPLKKQKK